VGWAILMGFCPKLDPFASYFSFSFRDIYVCVWQDTYVYVCMCCHLANRLETPRL
jgi:hypothetical protein